MKLVSELMYLPPVPWFALAFSAEQVVLDGWMHCEKRTCVNRCYIMEANRTMVLSIPLVRKGRWRTPLLDLIIDNSWRWREKHWRTLSSAYRSAPYFEYYEDELASFYLGGEPPTHLWEWNFALLKWLFEKLHLDANKLCVSEKFHRHYPQNYYVDVRWHFLPCRRGATALHPSIPYPQVFAERFGFVAGLSIVDLLFNMGFYARGYLEKIAEQVKQRALRYWPSSSASSQDSP